MASFLLGQSGNAKDWQSRQNNLINLKMHSILKVSKSKLTALVVTGLLSSCATKPIVFVDDQTVTHEPINQSSTQQGEMQTGDVATPFEIRDYQIEQAEHYQNLANINDTETDPIDAALSAAEFYLQASDSKRAEHNIISLEPTKLDYHQYNRYQIILAYIEYANHNYIAALNRLYGLLNQFHISTDSHQQSNGQDQPRLGPANQQRGDALLLLSFCYQALGEHDLAVTHLLERESILFGSARVETSRYIWQVINSLSREQRLHIIENTRDAMVKNRFEQSLHGQIGVSAVYPDQFDQWRQPPLHNSKKILEGAWASASPRNIAVLLPLTSRFNKAAQAVLDGIQYQHSLNQSIYKPHISVYDIGDSASQTRQYYRAAQQSGADLVIGPLGKDYANHLSVPEYPETGLTMTLPTILLGGDRPLSRRFTRLSISPERQGRIVAQRAFKSGYVTASLLLPDTRDGIRTANAFTRYWLNQGGKLSTTTRYSPKQFDHSVELKHLFDINQSENRHNKLSRVLGFKPRFSAYRRNDIDFIFMIADNDSGRIVRPQINFFSGGRIPVLASSSIYNGIQNPTNNVDLDQTSFPIMPWVLASNDVAPYAGQLNMLFAMGSDAYQLAAKLQEMRSDNSLAIQGNMGVLNIEPSGEVNHQPVWAQFIDGTAVPEEQLAPVINPLAIPDRQPNENRSHGQIRENSYNESNWDHRRSRRKTGP